MAAFALAREFGAPGLELDVRLCGSGELVVIHDDDCLRTTGVALPVESAPYGHISELDAGAGERIPRLSDVMDEFSGDLYIDIELKTKKTTNDPLPLALAEFLRSRAMTASGLNRRIVVSSFNPIALGAFKRAAPEYATAVIWDGSAELPWYLRRGQGRWISRCDYLKPNRLKATALSAALLSRGGGRPMVAWTVDDATTAEKLVGRGYAGIVTNRPQDIVRILR
jgi:glycerophosphoryl diester phosphodiesterase